MGRGQRALSLSPDAALNGFCLFVWLVFSFVLGFLLLLLFVMAPPALSSVYSLQTSAVLKGPLRRGASQHQVLCPFPYSNETCYLKELFKPI